MRAALEAAGLGARVEEADREAAAVIDDAVAFAEASPLATGILP
jgi:hypothetical protein